MQAGGSALDDGLIFDDDSDDNLPLASVGNVGQAKSTQDASSRVEGEEDAEEDVKLLKRTKRQRPRFTDADLMGPMGLEWVARTFPRMLGGSVKGRRGSEVRDERPTGAPTCANPPYGTGERAGAYLECVLALGAACASAHAL